MSDTSEAFAGAVDLSHLKKNDEGWVPLEAPRQQRATGIKFRRELEGGEVEFAEAIVIDKYPQMQDVHVEGRRIVEVSVELFIQLMETSGFTPVVPGTEEDH